MNWRLSGQCIEVCSCKMLCPCFFGPAEPDQGWCSGAIAFDVNEGHVNGTSLNGRKVVWVLDMPKDFASGNGTGRLYIDDGATAEQRRELEAFFTGKYGGPMGVGSALITTWLPTTVVPITIEGGDHPKVRVGIVGLVTTQRLLDQAGRPTRVLNAPIHQAFQVEGEDLARSDGSRWSDPGMRQWDAGGSGGVCDFSWSA